MLWVWVLAVSILLLGITLYWLFITTEGTYLGSRVVVLLYDWTARRYDAIKNLYFVNEARYLGIPVVEALSAAPHPRVLDVATGTGRLPLALLREPDFDGTVIGIDRSLPMLVQAQAPLWEYGPRAALLRQDSGSLGFMDDSFDAVTCLEAMEFMGHPHRVLEEAARVLKPGGVLCLSNRVGTEARFFPGRISGRGRLEEALKRAGMVDIITERWQVHYDLVWARKPASGSKKPLDQTMRGALKGNSECVKT